MLTEKLEQTRTNWSNWLGKFDWEETREGVNRESRARILLLGLTGAGKSTLLNQLCGWTVSTPSSSPSPPGEAEPTGPEGGQVEDFGLFCLVDLPPEVDDYSSSLGLYESGPFNSYIGRNGYEEPMLDLSGTIPLGMLDPLGLAEGANLLVYVLDGTVGVQAADYRWVGRLRRLGVPLLVVLNKSDLIAADLATRQAEVEARLATSVLPVSALEGTNVSDGLLTKMINICPMLTVALGRELRNFRHQAAGRLIHRAALLNGLVALEPVPLLDLPVQVITLTGLMLRIGAVYDRPPSDVRRREVVVAVAGGLVWRYAAQQLAKIVPIVGWGISSVIGWSCTWALGRIAIAYFEADGDATVDRGWGRAKGGVLQVCRTLTQRWQQRPRLKLAWEKAEPATPPQQQLDPGVEASAGQDQDDSGSEASADQSRDNPGSEASAGENRLDPGVEASG